MICLNVDISGLVKKEGLLFEKNGYFKLHLNIIKSFQKGIRITSSTLISEFE